MAELIYPELAKPAPGTITEVAAGVHWIRMPLPIALDHINLWALADGHGWTLVDSGMNTAEIRGLWETLLTGPLAGRPVKRLICTHLHPDHFGLAGWFSERWRVPLFMTAEEFMAGSTLVLAKWTELPWEIETFFRRAGLGDADVEFLARSGYGHFADSVHVPPRSFRRLVDGETLTIGGRAWRVVVGRGHSPEHACLHCPELNLLISGDQVLPRISSNVSVHSNEPEGNPLKQWLESLEAMKRLPAETVILPAHGEPFVGLHSRLNGLIHGHEKRLAQLVKRGREPLSAADTLPFLFRRELTGFSRLLAVGEALAHLHLLVDRGVMAIVDGADGVRRFRNKP